MGSDFRVEPRAFIADFGLAKAIGLAPSASRGSKLTKTGQALGTPAYMSPEQARGEVSSLTPATDVWSLGCLLYEMLAGRPPFEGETPAAVLGRALLSEPPRLRTLRGDLPGGIERLVRACLGKRARDRPPSALELRDDLDRVLRGERPWARVGGGRAPVLLAVAAAAGAATLLVGTGVGRSGTAAPALPAASEGARLSGRAHALRVEDPRRAAALLGDALALEPARRDWRLERGLLLWAIGDGPGAVAEWGRIHEDAREAPMARLYEGLEAFSRLAGGDATPPLEAAIRAGGRAGRLGTGALRAIAKDWAEAREALAQESGWEAALLRGYVEGVDPRGDRPAAVRQYGEALSGGIPLAWALSNRGAARRELGDPEGALRDFDEAIRLAPRDARALNNRGLTRRELGDLRGALADFDEAVRSDPSSASAWSNRGIVRMEEGDLAAALRDLDEAIRLDPADDAPFGNRATAYRRLGDLAAAERDFGEAIRLDPGRAALRSARGEVRMALGRPAEAIADYEEALRLDPRETDAWINLGVAHERQGDPSRAIEHFDQALRVDPRLAPAWMNRGLALRAIGDTAGAIRDYDEAIRLDPRLPQAWLNRGTARADAGDPAGAIRDLDEAIRLDPLYAMAWNNRGNVRANLGDAPGALRDYDEALRLDPRHALAWYNRALVLRRTGDVTRAVAEMEKALEVAPPDWPYREAVEETLAGARSSLREGRER
ncbi:MAG: tetratricopeptide repeat protein [Planctomycetales bacterium]|nr:tetratricopeptide repeat protein [Planctomycetales bacterium]